MFEATPEQLDQAARAIRDEVDPRNSQTPGFVESLFLIDRDRAAGLFIAVWEDANAVQNAEREAQAEQRAGALEATGGRRTSVEVYEVASLTRAKGIA
jgi:hypothetical protein